ncbi:MAG: hypothetical protein JNK70_14545 [Phycisphaerae bacterium]|nr:hypothetical protein [Phycisphaerae bacterium]
MERLQHEVDEKRKKIYLKSEKARKLYEAKEIEQVIFVKCLSFISVYSVYCSEGLEHIGDSKSDLNIV